MLNEPSVQKQPSPFEILNDEYRKQNGMMEELIARLTSSLHKLSDTNVPQGDKSHQPPINDLPFKEGQLMHYYNQNSRYKYLLNVLENEVNKIDQLL